MAETQAAIPEAVRLPDGQIEIWEGGMRQPVSRCQALLIAQYLSTSPIPASRERATAIRQACLETVQ